MNHVTPDTRCYGNGICDPQGALGCGAEHGPGIVEAIYEQHTHSLHTSVKSLLERLAEKGFVACRRHGGVHLFSATVARESFVAQQLQSLADSNFGGSLTPLLNTLVENVKLSRGDREAIRKIVDKIE